MLFPDESAANRVNYLTPVVEKIEQLCNDIMMVQAGDHTRAADVHKEFVD